MVFIYTSLLAQGISMREASVATRLIVDDNDDDDDKNNSVWYISFFINIWFLLTLTMGEDQMKYIIHHLLHIIIGDNTFLPLSSSIHNF